MTLRNHGSGAWDKERSRAPSPAQARHTSGFCSGIRSTHDPRRNLQSNSQEVSRRNCVPAWPQIYHPPQALLGPRPPLGMVGTPMATMKSWRLGQCQQKAQPHFKAISVRPNIVLTDQENLNRWTFNQFHIFGPLCDVNTVDFKLLKQIPPRLSSFQILE